MTSDSKITKGFLVYWNKIRCYGIIETTPNDLGVRQELFVHVQSIVEGDPIVGSAAEFEIYPGPQTRARLPALRVKFFPKVKITTAVIATLSSPVVRS